MQLLIKLTHVFIEQIDAIKIHYKLKTEAQEKYTNEVIKEFSELYSRGCNGEIQLPDETLVKFAKTKNIKQVEKLNQEIKKLNGLD